MNILNKLTQDKNVIVTATEIIFNKQSIQLLKIISNTLIENYNISIESNNAKIQLNNFNFYNSNVNFAHKSLFIIYNDNDIAELNNVDLNLKKYDSPISAYFYILKNILNINIVIQNDNIGITKNDKFYQIHIWNINDEQIIGVRLINKKDYLRTILFKNRKIEKIIIFNSLINLLKK